jgi:hypothetical protein
MFNAKTVLGITSIIMSSTIGIIGLVIESKKTNKLTDEDIELVADKTADKVIEKLAIMQVEAD